MRKSQHVLLKSIVLTLFLSSCQANNNDSISTQTPTSPESQTSPNLSLVANGEDFIRQGFVSKDGWQIDFNHAYVTLNDVTAYQTDPPFNADSQEELQATESLAIIEEPTTIDLALGDENAPPIKVTETSAPVGSYNAIAWSVVNNPQDEGSIILDGIAKKDDRTINFLLKFPLELNYVCGEFVGDERKGIVTANQMAELETTFHFDHIFGDAQTPADDELNQGALGFEPLAVIAGNQDTLDIDLMTLEQQLSPEDYNKLQDNLQSLGHVGEGHCRLTNNS